MTSPFNLLFYSPRFYPLVGGLEKVVRVWADELWQKGVKIAIITETAATAPDTFPFAVHRNIPFARQLRLMREADAVIQFNVSLKGLPAAIASGKPLIITHHTALFFPNGSTPWQQKCKRWVSDHIARGNIACSQYIAAQFRHAAVVHSPYEADLFVNQQKEREPYSIVFVGRLVSDKGVDLLIRAFAQIIPQYRSARLSIIGQGPDRNLLEALTDELALSDKIRFKGSLSGQALVDLLNEQAIMVVPSRMEPFGTTVLEGLACGCRMIVSNQGGLPEAAGGLARIFASGDVADLARALQSEMGIPQPVDAAALQAHLEAHTVAATATAFLEQVQQMLSV